MSSELYEEAVLSLEEIEIIAALSGVNRLLLFMCEKCENLMISGLNRLISERRITLYEGHFHLSPETEELFKMIPHAKTAVLITPVRYRHLPQVIVYIEHDKALTITPDSWRQNVFRIGQHDLSSLLEDLEMLKFLPPTCESNLMENEMLPSDEAARLRVLLQFDSTQEPAPEENNYVISSFQQIDVESGVSISRLTIYKGLRNWITATVDACNCSPILKIYNRDDIHTWMKGKLK